MRSPEGLLGALQLLQDHLDGLSKVQQTQILSAAFGGSKSASTIIALTSNLGDLDKTLGNIQTHTGDVGKELDALHAEPAYQLSVAWSQLNTVLIQLGAKIVPVAVKGISKLADIITDPKLTADEKFSRITDTITKAVEQAAGPVAKAAGGVVIAFLKGFADAWWHSDLLGKLFLTGGFIRLIGGPGVLGKLGVAIGKIAPASRGPRDAAGAAAGATAGAGAGAAGIRAEHGLATGAIDGFARPGLPRAEPRRAASSARFFATGGAGGDRRLRDW